MVDRYDLLDRLPAFENKKNILLHNQEVGDIIQGLLVNHNLYKKHYDKICNFFIGVNNRHTAHKIWKFLKNNVRYKIESDKEQLLKSPAAILQPGLTSDCKNYSLFSGGILQALQRQGKRINWCYRFSSYDLTNSTPQHVFVVIDPDTNKEVWLDAVLPGFDEHKQYYYKIDKKPNMALVALAGVDNPIGKKKKNKKRWDFFKKLKESIKKAGKFILKYNPASVASRNSFLGLVKLNVRSLATNLKKMSAKDDSIFKFWESIGGDSNKLKTAISQGATKKRLGAVGEMGLIAPRGKMMMTDRGNIMQSSATSHSGQYSGNFDVYETPAQRQDQTTPEQTIEGGEDMGYMGALPTLPAAAAAAPILVKVVKMISDFIKKNPGVIEESAVTDTEGALDISKKAGEQDAKETLAAIDKEALGVETPKGDQIMAAEKTKFPIMPIALAGGAILAFMLLKKKR